MNNDLISIVIPVFNGEKFLHDVIETILNQTYSYWEAIFIDDCSTDDSANIIIKYANNDSRIRYYKQEKNCGSALSRNVGIELANGNYLCFIDCDDLWDKRKLEKQIEFMKKMDCAFSYTSYEFANEKGIPNGKKVIARKITKYNQVLKDMIIWTSTVMFNLSLINSNLLKMPNLKYVEDAATWFQILRNGYDAYGIQEILSYYRRFKGTQSSNKFKTQRPLWNLYRNVEKIGLIKSIYCFCLKNLHALFRRL